MTSACERICVMIILAQILDRNEVHVPRVKSFADSLEPQVRH